jgi:hypothetical protein
MILTLMKVNRYMQEHSESQFYSTQDVLAAAKVLLWQRQRASVPKIKQLLRASMIQHGQNDWTSVFSICFVSCLCHDFRFFHLIGDISPSKVYCIEEDMNRVAGRDHAIHFPSQMRAFLFDATYEKSRIHVNLIAVQACSRVQNS